jgi:hypothetical protein
MRMMMWMRWRLLGIGNLQDLDQAGTGEYGCAQHLRWVSGGIARRLVLGTESPGKVTRENA